MAPSNRFAKLDRLDNAIKEDKRWVCDFILEEISNSVEYEIDPLFLEELAHYSKCQHLCCGVFLAMDELLKPGPPVLIWKALVVLKHAIVHGVGEIRGVANWRHDTLENLRKLSFPVSDKKKVAEKLNELGELLGNNPLYEQLREETKISSRSEYHCECAGCLHAITQKHTLERVPGSDDDDDEFDQLQRIFGEEGTGSAPHVQQFDVDETDNRRLWSKNKMRQFFHDFYKRKPGGFPKLKYDGITIATTHEECRQAVEQLKNCPCCQWSKINIFKNVLAFDSEFVSDCKPYDKWSPRFQYRLRPLARMNNRKGPFARWISLAHVCGRSVIVDCDDRNGENSLDVVYELLNDPNFTILSWAGRCDACALRNVFGWTQFKSMYDLQYTWKNVRSAFKCGRNKLGTAAGDALGADNYEDLKKFVEGQMQSNRWRNYWSFARNSPRRSMWHRHYVALDAVALFDLFVAMCIEFPSILRLCKMKDAEEYGIGCDAIEKLIGGSFRPAPVKSASEKAENNVTMAIEFGTFQSMPNIWAEAVTDFETLEKTPDLVTSKIVIVEERRLINFSDAVKVQSVPQFVGGSEFVKRILAGVRPVPATSPHQRRDESVGRRLVVGSERINEKVGLSGLKETDRHRGDRSPRIVGRAFLENERYEEKQSPLAESKRDPGSTTSQSSAFAFTTSSSSKRNESKETPFRFCQYETLEKCPYRAVCWLAHQPTTPNAVNSDNKAVLDVAAVDNQASARTETLAACVDAAVACNLADDEDDEVDSRETPCKNNQLKSRSLAHRKPSYYRNQQKREAKKKDLFSEEHEKNVKYLEFGGFVPNKGWFCTQCHYYNFSMKKFCSRCREQKR